MAQSVAFFRSLKSVPRPRSARGKDVSPRIVARLEGLQALETNWDGYNGRATKPAIARFASDVLGKVMDKNTPEPFLAPGGDGTVQAEWHIGGYTVELHFISGKQIDANRKNNDTGKWETATVSADNLSKIAEWVRTPNGATPK